VAGLAQACDARGMQGSRPRAACIVAPVWAAWGCGRRACAGSCKSGACKLSVTWDKPRALFPQRTCHRQRGWWRQLHLRRGAVPGHAAASASLLGHGAPCGRPGCVCGYRQLLPGPLRPSAACTGGLAAERHQRAAVRGGAGARRHPRRPGPLPEG